MIFSSRYTWIIFTIKKLILIKIIRVSKKEGKILMFTNFVFKLFANGFVSILITNFISLDII